MTVEINLTKLNVEQLEEIAHILDISLDYTDESEEMEMNFEAFQCIDFYISEL